MTMTVTMTATVAGASALLVITDSREASRVLQCGMNAGQWTCGMYRMSDPGRDRLTL